MSADIRHEHTAEAFFCCICFSSGNLVYVILTINIRTDCCLGYLTVNSYVKNIDLYFFRYICRSWYYLKFLGTCL